MRYAPGLLPLKIKNKDDLAQLLAPIASSGQEKLVVLSFDARKRVTHVDLVGIGTVNMSLVHPRDVFRAALKRNAVTVAVAHNHPSGDPSPSSNDLSVYTRLVNAGHIMAIPFHDNFTVTPDLQVGSSALAARKAAATKLGAPTDDVPGVPGTSTDLLAAGEQPKRVRVVGFHSGDEHVS